MTCVWTQFLIVTLGIIVIEKEVASNGAMLPYWNPHSHGRRNLHSEFFLRGKNAVTRKKFARQGPESPDVTSTQVAPKTTEPPWEPPPIVTVEEKPIHVTEEKQTPKPDDENQFLISPYAIQQQFSKLLSEFGTNFTSEIIGRTASYIDIYLYKIAQKNPSIYFRASEDKFVEDDTKDKKILFIVHALSPIGLGNLNALTLENYLKALLGFYVKHLDKFDIYFIPLANPDGFIKVKSVFKGMWNKNASPSNTGCPGVNVDRNFDVGWENRSQPLSSCSQHYSGETPFSEPESRAVRDVIHRASHKIFAYFHVHGGTYDMDIYKGDAVLYPIGFADIQSNDDKYIDLKGEIDEAIKNANFRVLSVAVDTLYNWYGKVTGTSVDYAAKVYGIPYSMELVMQVYTDAYSTQLSKLMGGQKGSLDYHALIEIWGRVIDVIFTNIHKKLEANDA